MNKVLRQMPVSHTNKDIFISIAAKRQIFRNTYIQEIKNGFDNIVIA